MVGWTSAHGGFENPLEYRARIRLRKVPLHLWNSADIHTLIAGFGYPLRIAPYFSNNNYGTLRMLIACGPPNTIPRQLWVTVDPIRKIVDVEVEGWDDNAGEVPPPDDAESSASRPAPPPPPPAPENPGPSEPSRLSLPTEPTLSGKDRRPARHVGPRAAPY